MLKKSWDYPGYRESKSPMTDRNPCKRKEREIWTQTLKHTLGKRSYEDAGRDWGDVATSQGMPGVAATTRSWETGMGQILHHRIQKKPVVLTPWFQVSSFQKCGRIHYFCFKPPMCGNWLQQPQEINTMGILPLASDGGWDAVCGLRVCPREMIAVRMMVKK